MRVDPLKHTLSHSHTHSHTNKQTHTTEQFGTLHSDQLLFQQVVAAVAQQQQQQHMEEEEELAVGGQIDPVLLGLQVIFSLSSRPPAFM